MYDASSDIYECMKRYDNVPGDQATNRNAPVTVIRLQLTEDDCVGKRKGRGIEGPVFVYYRVEKFYQTHRLLFESRNEEQLRGKIVTSRTDLEGCEPWIEVTDPNSTDPTDPTSSYYGKLLLPCGMFAKSVFNDTFEFSDAAGPLRVDTRAETISWNTERKHKYHNPPNSGRVVEWLKTYVPTSQGEFNPYRTDTGTELIFPGGIEDGHFMNWMRLAGLPNFRKLWGKINQDVALPVTVTIQSRWPVKSFGGEKWIILSTVTWLGGRNFFLAYSYFIVGGCCFIFGVFFLIRHWTDYRELGDVDFVALSQPGNK
ncbi:unnamed protein product [Vitrella brassicaformis CCMP3155]|uniref:ALA-interacting subunit n=2 Tax=Vitrella brassicaformis TaxID=1169539 RepID=A0A0G4H7M9_VITBC|nr:unnamed protein product [Vitrella brassicaformis CCMP3155]|eukprot:CEM39767.1 unnamed protein product [Vitrella brassicaformis CCMP3155]